MTSDLHKKKMWTFLVAGSLYLIGVAVLLLLRPRYMFTEDGGWKEFGIGQREEKYTPFPFWMFCIVWALVSYGLTLAIMPFISSDSSSKDLVEVNNVMISPNNTSGKNNLGKKISRVASQIYSKNTNEAVDLADASKEGLPKGYYVLNKKATRLSGAPKYMYLGPEEPVD